jgi:hypothetical protein
VSVGLMVGSTLKLENHSFSPTGVLKMKTFCLLVIQLYMPTCFLWCTCLAEAETGGVRFEIWRQAQMFIPFILIFITSSKNYQT